MQSIHGVDAVCQIVKHPTENMVLKVLANSIVLDFDVDARSLQDIWVSNTGKLEELRTLNDPSGQNDFFGNADTVALTVLAELDTSCYVPVQKNLRHHGLSQDFQVATTGIGKEISRRGIAASARIGSPIDGSEAGVEAHMISRPSVDQRTGLPANLVGSFAEVVFEWLVCYC